LFRLRLVRFRLLGPSRRDAGQHFAHQAPRLIHHVIVAAPEWP
jgi:hypothetical protein